MSLSPLTVSGVFKNVTSGLTGEVELHRAPPALAQKNPIEVRLVLTGLPVLGWLNGLSISMRKTNWWRSLCRLIVRCKAKVQSWRPGETKVFRPRFPKPEKGTSQWMLPEVIKVPAVALLVKVPFRNGVQTPLFSSVGPSQKPPAPLSNAQAVIGAAGLAILGRSDDWPSPLLSKPSEMVDGAPD